MEIRIKKGKGDVHALTCMRADGTATWSKLKGRYGPAHDLAHYVVETSLGNFGGFYGLLMQGHDITDFEEREDRTWIGTEGLYIECVVMGLQYIASGVDAPSAFNTMVEDACKRQEIPSRIVFSAMHVATLVSRYQDKLYEWNALQPGQSMVLSFPDKALEVAF
ncbi:MAG: hypothetical protein AAF564_14110 [Bacteroidota bacterium]